MSFGVEFTAYVNRVTPVTVKAEKEQAEDLIGILSEQLLALAADGSQKMYDDETDTYRPRNEIVAYRVPMLINDIVQVAGKLTLLSQAELAEDVRVF